MFIYKTYVYSKEGEINMKILDFNRLKRCLVFFLAFILAIPIISVPTAVHAATNFSDLKDHWAEQYIKTAVSKGFVSGYPDAKFRPDKDVSRAEFTSMINKALGNTGTVSISFSDVPSNEWYYKDIQKGMSASFVGGYDDNTFRPNAPVTRQEAAVMISRLIPTYGSSSNLQSYPDYTAVSDWASTAMSKVCGKKYMGPYKDGKLHPLDNLTRAQTAKILCDILNSETIASGTTTVRSNGTTLSNGIYTNDVVLHADLGDGEATLSNCIVLGTLYVYGGGDNTVTVKNSRVANAVVEKSASSVRLLASGESVIANASAGKTAILETSSLTGGLYGSGYNQLNVKGSADATLKGTFGKVNVIGSSAKVDFSSGTISTLTVDSSGRNSDITVGSSANVSTANVNGSAAFHGTGNISTMNANTADITYETKPKTVKGSYNPSSGSATLSNDGISITPKSGATKVDVDEQIVLTFGSAVTKYNGTTLSNSNIDSVIKLRKNSSNGSEVSFSSSINGTKKVITITPDKDMAEDTKYYVTIDNNALKIGSNGNSAFSSYFTTGSGSGSSSTVDGITISPKRGAKDIDVDTEITLTFDGAVTKYSNDGTLSDSSIDNYITIRKKTDSGTKVSFEGTIDKTKKVITLTPDSNLDEDTKYYVIIDRNSLKFNNSGNAAYTSYFTTGDESSSNVTFSPGKGDTGISATVRPTIKFSEKIEASTGKDLTSSYFSSSVIVFREESKDGTKVSFSASISDDKKITITPNSNLKAGKKYYLGIASNKLRTKSDEKNISETGVTWTTSNNIDTSSIDTAINNANAAKTNVKVSKDGIDVVTTALWVTQTQLDDLNNAISTASGKKTTVTTLADAQAAATVLTNATTTFNSNKRNGTKPQINTSALGYAIEDAKAIKGGILVSVDGLDLLPSQSWVTQATLDAFSNAISAAETAKQGIETSTQLMAQIDTMNNAVSIFKSKISLGKKSDKTALQTAITEANKTLGVPRIQDSPDGLATGTQWVTSSEYKVLASLIDRAIAIDAKRDASQEEVNAATSDLNAARENFPIKTAP